MRPLVKELENESVALIALSMLCLGEASKSEPFYLGSSDERIIRLFLALLRKVTEFDMNKVRCTIQCRADQDVDELKRFWLKVTRVPEQYFYRTQVDKRTIGGKMTRRNDYCGVLRVYYFDARVHRKLNVMYNLLAESVI